MAAVVAWGIGDIQGRPGSAGPPDRSELSPPLLIAALDTCIQKRFRKIDALFGIRRVVRLDDTPHVFRPGDTAEWDAVLDLDRAGLEVLLYVAGRRVLTDDPGVEEIVDARGWSAVKGPVEITRGSSSGEARPASTSLRDAARRGVRVLRARRRLRIPVRAVAVRRACRSRDGDRLPAVPCTPRRHRVAHRGSTRCRALRLSSPVTRVIP